MSLINAALMHELVQNCDKYNQHISQIVLLNKSHMNPSRKSATKIIITSLGTCPPIVSLITFSLALKIKCIKIQAFVLLLR